MTQENLRARVDVSIVILWHVCSHYDEKKPKMRIHSLMDFTLPTLTIGATTLALITTSCSDSGASGPNLVNRKLSENENSFRLVETSAERFRYKLTSSKPSGSEGGDTSESARQFGLTYTTPDGWTKTPGSPMRDVNLSFGTNGEGECYVARLPGMGGGLLANVNRWRQQMGGSPITQVQADALPVRPLFGQPAKFIKVDGKFSGMGATEGKDDYRMLGLILASEAGAVFVKMTGPRKLVEANEKNFNIFTNSLDVGP